MFRADLLAQNIKNCRMKMGLTQSELAEKLFVSGQTISKWESGQSVPDIDNLCMLSELFSTSVDKLIGNAAGITNGKTFIGIDGDGTNTEFVLFTENGDIIYSEYFKENNPEVCTTEKMCLALKRGIDSLISMCDNVEGVFAGIAGCEEGNKEAVLNEYVKKTYPLLEITIGSNIFNVISSIDTIERCVVVICGTGFDAFVNENGRLTRVGGWGYLLDNISGGYRIGRDALRAILAQYKGFGEKTVLADKIEKKLGGKVYDCLERIYSGGDDFIASFAYEVFEGYKKGDGVATEILEAFTDELAKLLKVTLDTYDCDKNIVVAGELMSDTNVVIELLCKKLGNDINYIKPDFPSIYGACYKCCKIYGKPKDNFFSNFNRSYKLLKLKMMQENR